jgi:LPXTG-site transpeptidase (sortase) family protein
VTVVLVPAKEPAGPDLKHRAVWMGYAAGALVLAAMAGALLTSALQTPPVHSAPQAASTFQENDPDTWAGNGTKPIIADGTRVLIPSLGIEVPWTEAGLHDGLLEIPSAPTAGWYNQSAKPGSAAGTTIIAAHVDYPDQSLTPFGHLAEAKKGAPVYVVGDAGKVYEYKITALSQTRQTTLPQSIFTRAGAPRLVLVTCAGKSLPESQRAGAQWGYEDNLLLTAELVATK